MAIAREPKVILIGRRAACTKTSGKQRDGLVIACLCYVFSNTEPFSSPLIMALNV
jgi:hypothetical protein